MSDFLADTVTVTTTSTKVLDASEFDRHVYFDVSNGGSVVPVFVGFSNATGAKFGSNAHPAFDFVLPASEELWLYIASGSVAIGLIATTG